MRVLIDECAPKALKAFLTKHGHESRTVQEAGWAGKQNGELLKLAETHFDAFVTVDTNLRYQQNLERRRIAIVILDYFLESSGGPAPTLSRLCFGPREN